MLTSRALLGLSAVLALAAVPIRAQQQASPFSDYKWASGLAGPPFGFDDMAETVFNRMINEPGRSASERLLGRSGIADLKRKQARAAPDHVSKQSLFDGAVEAMRAVKKEWTDKTSPDYFDVVFKLTDVLQQRGEAAMEYALDPTTSPETSEQIKEKARGDFTAAKTELDAVRQQFRDADYERQTDQWRLRARAWLYYCIMLYSEATAAKEGSLQQGTALDEAVRELDDFILEYDSADNDESMIGSLFGTIYRGKVARARDNLENAVASYESVLNFIRWDQPGTVSGVVQLIAEQAYFELLDALNLARRFEDARERGEKMEARFAAKQMQPGVFGRAARVEFARSCFETGDFGRALVVSSEVASEGRNDPSGIRAAKLIAAIIAAAPDKRRFDPEILLSAAKGAYTEAVTNPEKRGDAIAYYRMALPLLDKIADEKKRYETAVDAWLRYADLLQSDGLLLEAAHACAEGYRATWGQKKEALNSEEGKANVGRLFTKLKRVSEEYARSTKQPSGQKVMDEFNALLMRVPPPDNVAISPGDVRFDEAQKLEREGKLEEAIAVYQEVSGKPPEYKDGLGGRYAERSIVKANGCAAKIAKRMRDKKDPGAPAAMERALSGLEGFIRLAEDAGKPETDPTKVQQRRDALAEAKWQLSDLRLDLAEFAKEEAEKAKLYRAVLDILAGFEAKHKEQSQMFPFAIANRIEAAIGLNDLARAKTEYAALKAAAPDHAKFGEMANKLGLAIRKVADEKRKTLDPKKDAAAIDALAPHYLESAGYYRDWLLQTGSSGAKTLGNWQAIGRMFFEGGDLAAAADILRQGLERFANVSTAKPEELQICRYYLVRANDAIAEKLVREDKDASRLFSENGRLLADHLMTETSKYKNARDVWRIAARTWGGFLYEQQSGNLRYYAGVGDFARAFDVWRNYVKRSAENGSDEYWESTFYEYYLRFKLAEASGKQDDLKQIRQHFQSLKVTQPLLGGPRYKPWFEWLDRALL
jgi:hypothetical protein